MKVHFEYDLSLGEDEVYVRLSPDNPNRENLMQILTDGAIGVTGKIDDKIYLLSADDIESVYSNQNNVFACCGGVDYRIKEKLYEMEKRFEHRHFMRISKSVIINVKKIDHISPSFNRQLMFKMLSGAVLYSSRSYNVKIKNRLGV